MAALVGMDFLFYLLFDCSGIHVGNLSDGEFSGDLGRDDRLGSGIGKSPLDAVDGHSGVSPQVS